MLGGRSEKGMAEDLVHVTDMAMSTIKGYTGQEQLIAMSQHKTPLPCCFSQVLISQILIKVATLW